MSALHSRFIIAALTIIIGAAGCTPSQTSSIQAPDILSVITSLSFTLSPSPEPMRGFVQSLWNHVYASSSTQTVIIMKDDDRVASALWMGSENAERDFLLVKKAAFRSFSSQVENVTDTIIQREGFSPISLVAFSDMQVSEEAVILARIRNRIFEFHIAVGKEGWIHQLLLELARITS